MRKALRSLCLLGTSQGVAQAVMWNVCNDLPFETMVAEAGKVMNVHEIALAARFVEAVDASSDADLVDPAYLDRRPDLRPGPGAEGPSPRTPSGSTSSSKDYRLLGLPVQTLERRGACPPRRPRRCSSGWS